MGIDLLFLPSPRVLDSGSGIGEHEWQWAVQEPEGTIAAHLAEVTGQHGGTLGQDLVEGAQLVAGVARHGV